MLPPAYLGDALIAFHGTGAEQVNNNLSGYTISRVHFNGQEPTSLEPLVTGWLKPDTGQAWGRPAGLELDYDGSILISDDLSVFIG